VPFVAEDIAHGREVWRTNGTASGTRLVKDIKTGRGRGSDPSDLTALHDTLLFAASGSGGRELWATDGTSAGTLRVRDIRPDGSSSPSDLVARGSRVYFSADDGTSGRELWRTDGTLAGTRRVKDILPGARSSSPHGLTRVGDRIVFAADDGEHGVEPWQSDGSAAGTVLVADIMPAGSSLDASADERLPVRFGAAGGRVYVAADDGSHGRELWSWEP
jgi:ELWxxDGT repeat protein